MHSTQFCSKLNKSIVIFASGAGTNAARIIIHFANHNAISVTCLFTDRASSGAVDIGKKNNIPVVLFDYAVDMGADGMVMKRLSALNPDLIVLAGFLRLMPAVFVERFTHRIINLHPALLPAYGGKGFYGNRIHQAVIADKQHQSGITIHFVNEHYDKGDIISQHKVPVENGETSASLAAKIHALEYEFYPLIIEQVLEQNK